MNKVCIDCRDVDVAIIAFNEEAMLQKSLPPLLAAGFDSFVVADMDSTDQTKDVLQRLIGKGLTCFSFPRASLIRHGFAAARNVCASYCQRPWILFIDADEILTHGIVQKKIWLESEAVGAHYFSIGRQNLISKAGEPRVAGGAERHGRLYRPTPAVHWLGYIHEEIRLLDLRVKNIVGRTSIEIDHLSSEKDPGVLEEKEGLYSFMLMRAFRNPDVRVGMPDWYFENYIPQNIDLLTARALGYAKKMGLGSDFEPIGDRDKSRPFFDVFTPPELGESSFDLSSARALHVMPMRPWADVEGYVHWAEWQHPAEQSRSMTSITQSLASLNWNKLVKPGTIAIDIGAHSGDTAIPMAVFGYNSVTREKLFVVCVEPNPAVHAILRLNLSLNTHVGEFLLLNAAITDQDVAEIELADHGNSECNGGVLDGNFSPSLQARLKDVAGVRYMARGVSMTTLFEELRNLSSAPISFIKLDCEGYDKEILRSCKDLLSQDKPALFVEWFAWMERSDDEDLFGVIDAIGYVAIEPATLRHASVDRRVPDLLCVHKTLADEMVHYLQS